MDKMHYIIRYFYTFLQFQLDYMHIQILTLFTETLDSTVIAKSFAQTAYLRFVDWDH